MLTIRLQRRGRKNDPSFRVIVVEAARAAKTGSHLEVVGHYDPRVDSVDLKADRIKHWISQGATVSDTVHNILINQKVIEGKKINVLPRKSPPKKEETPAPVEAQAAAPEVKAEEPVSNEVAPETPAQ